MEPARSSAASQTASDAVNAAADFGLSSRAIDLLRATLAAQPQVDRALIYGSRAKGNFRPGSDIDIALDAPSLSYNDFVRLVGTLDDLMLPWQIDLSVLHQIDNPDLLEQITRVGRPLWTKTP